MSNTTTETQRPPSRLNSLVVWAIVLGCLAAYIVCYWLLWRYASDKGSPFFSSWLIFCVPVPAVGAFILSRKPGHGVGLAMLVCGICASLETLAGGLAVMAAAQPQPDLMFVRITAGLAQSLWSGALALALAIALFPTGRFPSPRWRWVGIALIAAPVILVTTALTFVVVEKPNLDGTMGDDYKMFNQPVYAAVNFAFGVIAALGLIGALAALLVRAKRSHGVEHQQIKWFALFGSAGIVMMFLPTVPWALNIRSEWVTFLSDSKIAEALTAIALLGMIAAIGIAIVRHRLFDIDLIIRRTLIYGLLTTLLAGTYFVLVALLQRGLAALTGQNNSDVVTVVSTLAVAGLFLPARNAVQRLIDRRFFRTKYNAEQVLARFSQDMRDAVEMDEVTTKLLDAVDATMQPKEMVLWVVKGDKRPSHRT